MGTKAYHIDINTLPGHDPPLSQYTLVSSGPNLYIYYNPLINRSLIEYIFPIQNKQLLHTCLCSYLWRHNNSLLVSTQYFKQNVERQKYSIFYQRVFTSLCRIKDISFEDSLQFYYVGLKGFEMMYGQFGYFQVKEEMFYVTQSGRVKVWCDKNIDRLFPATKGNGSQQSMIYQIIKIVDTNTDHSRQTINIAQILRDENVKTFESAIKILNRICKQCGFNVISELHCIKRIHQAGLIHMVDVYDTYLDPKSQSTSISIPQNKQYQNRSSTRIINSHLQNKILVSSINKPVVNSGQKLFIAINNSFVSSPKAEPQFASFSSIYPFANQIKKTQLNNHISSTTIGSIKLSQVSFSPARYDSRLKNQPFRSYSQSKTNYIKINDKKLQKPVILTSETKNHLKQQSLKKKPIKAHFTYSNKRQNFISIQSQNKSFSQKNKLIRLQTEPKQQSTQGSQKWNYHDSTDFKQLAQKLRQKYCKLKMLDYEDIQLQIKASINKITDKHIDNIPQNKQDQLHCKQINSQQMLISSQIVQKQQNPLQQNVNKSTHEQIISMSSKKYTVDIDTDIWTDVINMKKKTQQTPG